MGNVTHQPGLLSILMPLWNERELVEEALRRVLAAPLPEGMSREILVVDDGSDDGSAELVQQLALRHPEIRLLRHPRNRGKGAAVATALAEARGEFSIIQDADLEYDPSEIREVLRPLLEHKADAVYGSRFQFRQQRHVLYFWHSVGNTILTMLCNMAADLNLTDMSTCYKAFRTSLGQSIPIRSSRFGFEPEWTIKLAQREARIYEVPISYNGRTYEEGKKIRPFDGIKAIFTILRFGLTRDIYRESGPEILDILAGAPRFNQWLAEQVQPFLGERVVEIGAGIGNLSQHLMKGRRLYIGADLDAEHLARLGTRFEGRTQFRPHHCDVARWEDMAPLEGQVDSAVSLNVIEHVKDDEQAFRNLFRILPQEGSALILVPQDQAIFGTLDEVLGHWRRYSPELLRSRAEQAGFVVERIWEFNRITRPAWWWNACVLKRTTFSRFQIWIFDRFVWLWRILDRILPWPGTSLILAARKPSSR
jgi:glycosyltransferase involved in cell wall biosynthesis